MKICNICKGRMVKTTKKYKTIYKCSECNVFENKNIIEYQNRYSQTDEPDKQGRWARAATYKNIRVAWISKHFIKDKYTFCVTCHFPTMQNDTANESKVFFSLEDAKDFVSERWNFFLTAVS